MKPLTIALSAISLAVSACATHPASPPIPPVVDRPAPSAPDPRLCADVPKRPELPPEAGLVQAVTAAERAAQAAYLGWVAAVVDHDGLATARADLARHTVCR